METFTPQEAPNLIGALRHCFFSADKSKMVDCVSASVAIQHIEATIYANNIHLDNQSIDEDRQ
jgi:hypothetical protein